MMFTALGGAVHRTCVLTWLYGPPLWLHLHVCMQCTRCHKHETHSFVDPATP